MIHSGSRLTAIDTNVILRNLLRDDEAQYAAANAFLGALTPDRPGFVTHVTLAEVHWTLGTRGFSRRSRLEAIQSIVETESFEFEDGEAVVRALSLAQDEGADFADALIQGSMELFGVDEAVTFDRRAAKRLGWRLLSPA